MADTAAGGTVLTRRAYEATKAGLEEGETIKEEEVEMTGAGGASAGPKVVVVRDGVLAWFWFMCACAVLLFFLSLLVLTVRCMIYF